MFVFLFEHVKLRSIIIIGGTNERCSACSNNRTNTSNLISIFSLLIGSALGIGIVVWNEPFHAEEVL